MSDHAQSPSSDLTSRIIANARAGKSMSTFSRRQAVSGYIKEAANAELQLESDILEAAYGDSRAPLYWSGLFAKDFSGIYDFIDTLEAHKGRVSDVILVLQGRASGIRSSEILNAIEVASRANPAWLRNKHDKDANLGRAYSPSILAHWEICRGEAAEWLLAHPEFRELLPVGGRDWLNRKDREGFACAGPNAAISSGVPGRPTSKHIVACEITRLEEAGEKRRTILAWAKELSGWLAENHPAVPQMSPGRIRTAFSSRLRPMTDPKA